MIVGAQPRSALDVDTLKAEGVDVILNLQQDKDLAVSERPCTSGWMGVEGRSAAAGGWGLELHPSAGRSVACAAAAAAPPQPHSSTSHHPPACLLMLQYWKVDLQEISSRAAHHGMTLIRTPAVDFSPHSLRETLPTGEPQGQGCGWVLWVLGWVGGRRWEGLSWSAALALLQHGGRSVPPSCHCPAADLSLPPCPRYHLLQPCARWSAPAPPATRSTCTAPRAWAAPPRSPLPRSTGSRPCSWTRPILSSPASAPVDPTRCGAGWWVGG